MLPSQFRLKGQHNFQQIYKYGKKVWNPYFLFIYRNSARANTQNSLDELNTTKEQSMPNSQYPKLGFVASKKVGGAVQRNKAKRLLREYAMLHIKELPNDLEGVFVASKKTLEIEINTVIDIFKKSKQF